QSQLQSAMTYIVPSGLTAAGSQSTGYTFTTSSATDTYTAAAGTFGTGASGTGSSAAITTPSTLTQIAADLNASGTGYSATLNSTNTAMTVTASSSTPATLAATAPTLSASGSGSISSMTQLGISVNNDGTLTLNVSALDATLSSNYQDVVNFLQPSSAYTSFGGNFTAVLNNLGTQAPTGSIYLAQQQNQTIETSLNTNITNENALIAQQTQTLTTELNQANFTLTEIPQQLSYVNELYSSYSGYNINPNFG
ncbi:MAG: flagellar filament capping protein FliD, partial [Acidobacteriaceae bacterium]